MHRKATATLMPIGNITKDTATLMPIGNNTKATATLVPIDTNLVNVQAKGCGECPDWPMEGAQTKSSRASD